MLSLPSHVFLRQNFNESFVKSGTLDDSGLDHPSQLSNYFMLSIKIHCSDVFHAFAGLNPGRFMNLIEFILTVLLNYAFVLASCLVKHPCLSTFTLHSCWKFTHFQLISKKVQ